MEVLSI